MSKKVVIEFASVEWFVSGLLKSLDSRYNRMLKEVKQAGCEFTETEKKEVVKQLKALLAK